MDSEKFFGLLVFIGVAFIVSMFALGLYLDSSRRNDHYKLCIERGMQFVSGNCVK